MFTLLNSTKYYFEPKVAIVFFLGISSGLPFLLILSTLSVWLIEAGIMKTHIGLLAWVTLPYTLKFCLAPWFDQIKLPILTKMFGHKRAWLLVIQILLMGSILGLGSCHPAEGLFYVSMWAFLVGLFSSAQDILIEGHRIDAISVSRSSYGASASVIGYRVGMLLAGAGALYLSSVTSWQIVYGCMAMFILIGIIATLCSSDHETCSSLEQKSIAIKPKTFFDVFITPLKIIFKRSDWLIIFVFMLSFKACDTILNTMNMPFLIEIGFSKVEIAHVAKSFGIAAMVVGGICGGILFSKYKLSNILQKCMIMQIIASLLFMLQAVHGNDIRLLFLTMGVESFTCGLSQVALIYYLTLISKGSFSRVVFAFLTSIASFDRVGISMVAGFLADNVSWLGFFTVSSLVSLPAIWILYRYVEHFADINLLKDANSDFETNGVIASRAN